MTPGRLGYKHKKVQRLRRLMRQASLRDAERVFVVEGSKLLDEALLSGARIESVFVAPGDPPAVVRRAESGGHRVHHLESGVIERVTDATTPQPVVAIVHMCDASLADVAGGRPVVVLVDVRDPGNAGTICRSAEAAGFAGIVFCDGSVDPYNPKTVRASAGSLFHTPFVRRIGTAEALAQLRDGGRALAGTAASGATVYTEADLTRPVAVVMGNEASGLPPDIVSLLDEMLSVPIEGRSESLNVSMALTVIAFEAARQRRASAANKPE